MAPDAATPAPFEGETTLNSQSDYARELLTQAIGNTPSMEQNAEIRSALTALKDLVSQQGQIATSSNPLINRSFADFDPAKLERPPWDAASGTLDKACKYPTMAFAIIFPFLKMKNLKDILEDAYFNAGSCPAPRRVLAYGVMENIFTEFKAFPLADQDVSKFGAYSNMCKRHMEVAMSQLDIFMPASYENIMALLISAAQSIELCKPSLCWVMISTAAGLCQNLGYHRINTMTNDTVEEQNAKIHIFWMIYMFDKTLSLRLGRASIIQDWDISLPFLLRNEEPTDSPDGSQMLAYWIRVARVQGLTYEKLFCPAAFLKSPEERARIANDLVNAMNEAWFERGEATVIDFTGVGENIKFVPQRTSTAINSPSTTEIPSRRQRVGPTKPSVIPLPPSQYIQGSFERIQDIFFHSDVVMHYSTCALIQRAVSPDNVTFNQECLESSRAALAAHMRANAQFNTNGNEELWSGYVHWSILNAPFTPFIVIFCHVIQKNELSDLNSLFDFVASLESCRTLSEGADKLYKMCHMFSQIAKLYVQAKSQEIASRAQTATPSTQPNYYTTADGTQLDLNAMNSFDPYLSALGLMPNWAWPVAGGSPTSGGYGATQGPSETASYTQAQAPGGLQGANATNLGFGPPGGYQNAVQDWFSGSRYLMNMMEGGEDFQMPDVNL
ncbi:hypothetical protein T440DRAFT_469254 [Plenodomus tracheiphilus IPT5]|uniref:Xylanolytic transcriptional activator regulatory domain-containing protein n=1 Tax=Plenodomus tracheiphilus IPT5 TaxID=1408161 RepID=A0A6A7B4X0_9PLEO|nr:hypothetical protein T440DRAFT_469254 [Plenodomus tracheiphilus IPT5]